MSPSLNPQFTDEQVQDVRAKLTQFRILVIGRAHAGKTTILRRLCNTIGKPTIFSSNGEKIESSALNNDIKDQIIFEGNPGFIFHDSRGFEAGGAQELKLVQEFIEQRSRAKNMNEQLHAIWYCVPTSDSDRPITKAEKIFFNECGTGHVPVIILWTKTESLDLEKIIQLTKQGISKPDAMKQAPQKALADYEKNTCQIFDRFKYPPKAYVALRQMHEPGADCKDLIEKTTAVLLGDQLRRLGNTRTGNSTESIALKDNNEDHALISARNILITGGTLVSVKNGGFHMHMTCDNRMEILRKMTLGALHDSEERHNPPKCHPATRRALLKKIMEWVEDLEKLCHFMWLYGPVGVGKSAIAQTIAELCYETNILAGSFFFSSTDIDSTRLIFAIAYQLSLSIPEVRCYVEAVVERDSNIFRLSLEAQVQKLIVWPLSQVNFQSMSSRPISSRSNLIVIDGLDECSDENQRCILSALSGVFKSHGFPICFLITSRPAQHIRESFNTEPLSSMTTFLSLDDNDNDIQVWMRSKFDEIKREHPLNSRIPLSWPSEMDVKRLVQRSSGQFIYASAVTKFVESPQHQPMKRLDNIFYTIGRGNVAPFAELDALYNRIFSLVDDIHTVQEVLSILLFSEEYWFPCPVNLKLIGGLLHLQDGDLYHKLIHLRSILDVPALDDDKTKIRILFGSLREFLQDQTRSGQYYIDEGRVHAKLTRRFMTLIQSFREEYGMDEFLRFSCQFFMVHCVLSYPTPELLADLRNFNISGFLSLLSSTYLALGLSPVTINRQISDLFTWLKRQVHKPPGKDLHTSYLLAWDKHMITSLIESVPVRLSGLFVASALHPQFWKYCTVIREIVNWKEPQDEAIRFSNSVFQFLCAGEPDEEGPNSTGYHKMLSQFLNDPNRSGPLCADEDKFTRLAIKTVQFIIHREVGTSKFAFTDYVLPYDDLRIWASECLPFFLSKVSYTEFLATRLETDLLPLVKRFRYHSHKNKSEVIAAINNYIYSV